MAARLADFPSMLSPYRSLMKQARYGSRRKSDGVGFAPANQMYGPLTRMLRVAPFERVGKFPFPY